MMLNDIGNIIPVAFEAKDSLSSDKHCHFICIKDTHYSTVLQHELHL